MRGASFATETSLCGWKGQRKEGDCESIFAISMAGMNGKKMELIIICLYSFAFMAHGVTP